MDVEKRFITPNQYSRPTTKRNRTTKVAVHYIGNAGSSAMANRNFFNNLANQSGDKKKRYASSHYIIGLQGEIIQCIPEDEIAYTTNSANAYSIGIEVCHPKWDGVFTEVSRKALVELVADICKRYNLNPIDDIIRHYDITGKSCPICWASNGGSKYQDYLKFKNEVKECMNRYNITKVKVDLFGMVKMVDAINIDNYNHVKLRDLNCNQIQVGWNGRDVLVNGKVFKANGIVHENYNYIKIRELEKVGINIGWDSATQTIILR